MYSIMENCESLNNQALLAILDLLDHHVYTLRGASDHLLHLVIILRNQNLSLFK